MWHGAERHEPLSRLCIPNLDGADVVERVGVGVGGSGRDAASVGAVCEREDATEFVLHVEGVQELAAGAVEDVDDVGGTSDGERLAIGMKRDGMERGVGGREFTALGTAHSVVDDELALVVDGCETVAVGAVGDTVRLALSQLDRRRGLAGRELPLKEPVAADDGNAVARAAEGETCDGAGDGG